MIEGQIVEGQMSSVSKLVLEETKKILTMEKNNYSNCISVYDVGKILLETRDYYVRLLDEFKQKMDLYFKNSNPGYVKNFDDVRYEFDEIIISYFDWSKMTQFIRINKICGELHVMRSTNKAFVKEILFKFADELSDLYDVCEASGYFLTSDKYIKSINSKFFINISKLCVSISDNYSDFTNEFKLSLDKSATGDDQYECESDYYNSLKTVKGIEEKIFKGLYVNIEDCPEWMHEKLYEVRQKQLIGCECEEYKDQEECKEENTTKVVKEKFELPKTKAIKLLFRNR